MRYQHMQGVTLLEVLISLVILAFALLGIAALHGLGAKYGNKAYYRSQAIAQAYDIVDRMRANPAATLSDYAPSTFPTGYSSDCGSGSCSVADMVTYDLVTWNTVNGNTLPSGSGAITVSGTDVTVVVNWVEDVNNDGAADLQSVSVTAQL